MTITERVARAICERAGIDPDKHITLMQPHQSEVIGPFGYEKASNFAPAWQFFTPHAADAIEAMRSSAALDRLAALDGADLEVFDVAAPDPDPA